MMRPIGKKYKKTKRGASSSGRWNVVKLDYHVFETFIQLETEFKFVIISGRADIVLTSVGQARPRWRDFRNRFGQINSSI